MPNPVLIQTLKICFRIALRFAKKTPPFSPSEVERILIVNTTAIGDTLLSTGALREIKRQYPQSEIIALVSKEARTILQNNPHLDGIINHPGRVDWRYIFHLLRLLRQLRRPRFSLAVILNANDPDIIPLLFLAGIPNRYGWAESKLAFLLTLPVQTRRAEMHALVEKVHNLKTIGVSVSDDRMEIFLTDDERQAAQRFLDENHVTGPYICFHPFGNRVNRWWVKIEAWRRLGEIICRDGEVKIIVLGGAREEQNLEKVAPLPPGFISAVGKLKLRESAALIAKSEIVISTDSGPLHLAQALGVKTVGLFGPSLPGITGPRLPGALIVKGKEYYSPANLNECTEPTSTEEISPETVAAAIKQLWHSNDGKK